MEPHHHREGHHSPSEPDTAHTAHTAHTPDTADTAALAELLDLDAEVMRAHLSEVTAWIEELTAGSPPRHVLDLGSGTGAGVLALLARFGTAEATAVDVDPGMLDRLGEKARARGVADRVRTVRADLDAGWPDVGTTDLVWASASLHHLADPGRVLADVLGALRPGGLLAVVELDSFPRFLPEDVGIGSPGVEARVHAVMDAARAAQMPHVGSDWGTLLADAGFAVEAERIFDIALTPPLPTATGRYAQLSLRRIRSHLGDRLTAEDRATLDTLLDGDGPEGIAHRDDLTVSATRSVWLARRP